MKAAEHYEEAERLLELSTGDNGLPRLAATAYTQAAAVHALLAIAAAVLLPRPGEPSTGGPTSADGAEEPPW